MLGNRIIDTSVRMEFARLCVTSDNGSTTIPSPGAGKAIRVYGYLITEQQQANATINTAAYLCFDGEPAIWEGITLTTGAHYRGISSISGLTITGPEDKGMILTNSNVNAAAGRVIAHVFYGKIYRE